MSHPLPATPFPFAAMLRRGFRVPWQAALLLAAINTGIAALVWRGDTRPLWQRLLTVQLYGFSIAYCVNAASPWEKPRPILRLAVSVLVGTLIGVGLTILIKGYTLEYVASAAL